MFQNFLAKASQLSWSWGLAQLGNINSPLKFEILELNYGSLEIFISILFQVFSEKIDFPTREISLSEFQKTGRGLSSLCILVKKSKTIRKI